MTAAERTCHAVALRVRASDPRDGDAPISAAQVVDLMVACYLAALEESAKVVENSFAMQAHPTTRYGIAHRIRQLGRAP